MFLSAAEKRRAVGIGPLWKPGLLGDWLCKHPGLFLSMEESVYQALSFAGVCRRRLSVSEEQSLLRARLIGSSLHRALYDF